MDTYAVLREHPGYSALLYDVFYSLKHKKISTCASLSTNTVRFPETGNSCHPNLFNASNNRHIQQVFYTFPLEANNNNSKIYSIILGLASMHPPRVKGGRVDYRQAQEGYSEVQALIDP